LQDGLIEFCTVIGQAFFIPMDGRERGEHHGVGRHFAHLLGGLHLRGEIFAVLFGGGGVVGKEAA